VNDVVHEGALDACAPGGDHGVAMFTFVLS